MKLKLIAALSLAALLGCTGAPTLPNSAPQAQKPAPGGLSVQGVVTATIESAEVVRSTKRLLPLPLTPTAFAYMVPKAQASMIPEGVITIYVKPVEGVPNRYERTEDVVAATHITYQGSLEKLFQEVLATFGGKLGETPAMTLPPQLLPPMGGFPLIFPAGAEGALTLTLPAETALYFFQQADEDKAEFLKTVTVPESVPIPESPHLKDANITFTVTDEKGNLVPGLTSEFFTFSLSPTPDDADAPDISSPTPILEFEELSAGKYRISSIIHLMESGSLRFRVDVVNPAASTEANFYRR